MAASEGLILNRRNTLRKAQAEINEAGYLELHTITGVRADDHKAWMQVKGTELLTGQ